MSTGNELGNSALAKSSFSNVHANYAWLEVEGLDASILPASRCPSPGYFVEPGDSREPVEELIDMASLTEVMDDIHKIFTLAQ